jgi:hypothetical protein
VGQAPFAGFVDRTTGSAEGGGPFVSPSSLFPRLESPTPFATACARAPAGAPLLTDETNVEELDLSPIDSRTNRNQNPLVT